MNKSIFTILVATACCVWLLFVCSCESDAQTGGLIGAAVGAGAGQAIGRDTEGTLIGAAAGGGIGYVIGNESDKKKAAAERDQIREEMNYVTVNITNSNGSITQVRLRRQGAVYIGPKGETYSSLPTEEQLRPLYGL